MKERVMEQVLAAKRAEKARAAQEAESRKDAAFAVPEISAAQQAYVEAYYSDMFRHGKLSERTRALHEEYLAALAAHGFSESDFQPAAVCPVCNDTGTVNGQPCECVRAEFVKQLGIACDIAPEGFCFDDFSVAVIADGAQAENLNKIYSKMRAYTEKYPAVNRRIIVMSGKTGTGKTVLATAMARNMIRRGYSALILSAMNFNSLMVKCHTSPYSERDGILRDVMDADMLVIDDLGTEPRYRNVTCEYLLLVLEERSSRKLSTVITTNLSPDDIMRQYNERIYSRMCDKRGSLFLPFTGDDLRLK